MQRVLNQMILKNLTFEGSRSQSIPRNRWEDAVMKDANQLLEIQIRD